MPDAKLKRFVGWVIDLLMPNARKGFQQAIVPYGVEKAAAGAMYFRLIGALRQFNRARVG